MENGQPRDRWNEAVEWTVAVGAGIAMAIFLLIRALGMGLHALARWATTARTKP